MLADGHTTTTREGVGWLVTNSGWRGILEHVPRHNEPHDFVGALEDLVHAHIPQVSVERIVLQVAVATKQLQRIVADLCATCVVSWCVVRQYQCVRGGNGMRVSTIREGGSCQFEG